MANIHNSCTEEHISSVQEDVEKAFEKIIRCVNVREQSSQRMREKLHHAGFSVSVSETALARAVACGAIDDARYCECLIRSALSQGKDLRFALKEIEALDVDVAHIEAYQEYLELSPEQHIERALAVLRKSRITSKNVYASCQRKLLAKGYSYHIASQATHLYLQECESSPDNSMDIPAC